eukprot:scaffold125195_cov44-Prasinocladus_malaysianus.AAC.4
MQVHRARWLAGLPCAWVAVLLAEESFRAAVMGVWDFNSLSSALRDCLHIATAAISDDVSFPNYMFRNITLSTNKGYFLSDRERIS